MHRVQTLIIGRVCRMEIISAPPSVTTLDAVKTLTNLVGYLCCVSTEGEIKREIETRINNEFNAHVKSLRFSLCTLHVRVSCIRSTHSFGDCVRSVRPVL